MKRLVIFIFSIALVMSLAGCKKHNKTASNQPKSDTLSYANTPLPFAPDTTTTVADSNQTTVEIKDTNQVMTVDTVTNKIKPVSDEVVKQQKGKIYIIVGSFKVYGNALRLKQYYKRLGYNPQILPQVAGYNRVAIKSFDNLAQARHQLHILRHKFHRPDFWLLYKK